MDRELTTISLAIRPVSRATAACQKPKPRGLKMGAMTLPRAPSMLSASFSTICREKSKDWSSQSRMLISRIRVPALMRKPFTFCHTWVSMLCREGRR